MQNSVIEIITLVENLAYQQGTKGEHGLSYLVKTGGRQILFDTGQSDLLIHNAKRLNMDLSQIDDVVISHGHYDHTGGLEAFFQVNEHAPVWLKPGAFAQKMSKSTGAPRFIGIDPEIVERYKNRFRTVSQIMELAPELKVVTEIGHYYEFEQPAQSMLINDGDQLRPDQFDDELFMLFDHPEGIVVLAGCAHRGIANICRSAMKISGKDHIKLVLGGTHLKGDSKGRISKTVHAFKELDVGQFGLCHCTGLPAFMEFANTFDDKVRYAHVATSFLPFD